jgi:hypothetical protein
MDIVICSKCGQGMERYEDVIEDGAAIVKDWEKDTPVCPICRGVPGAQPLRRPRDVLGGFGWKRDPKTGKKVPK